MVVSSFVAAVALMAVQPPVAQTDTPPVPADAPEAIEAAPPPAAAATSTEVAPAPLQQAAGTAVGGPAPDERLRVLVLNVVPREVPASAAETIEGLLTVKLSERKALNVVSRADLAAALSMEADREALGCNETSCLGEIAGALDARLIVYGDIARVEDEVVVTLSLFDAEQASALARETVRARKLLDVADRLDAVVNNLLAPLLGHPAVEVPPVVDEGFTKDDYIRIGGITTGVAGVGIGALGWVAGTVAYGAEFFSLFVDAPDDDAAILALLLPIAGPLLYVVVDPVAANSPGAIVTAFASFGFQFVGVALLALGAVIATGGFATAYYLPEDGLE
jgi:TolB-like protein